MSKNTSQPNKRGVKNGDLSLEEILSLYTVIPFFTVQHPYYSMVNNEDNDDEVLQTAGAHEPVVQEQVVVFELAQGVVQRCYELVDLAKITQGRVYDSESQFVCCASLGIFIFSDMLSGDRDEQLVQWWKYCEQIPLPTTLVWVNKEANSCHKGYNQGRNIDHQQILTICTAKSAVKIAVSPIAANRQLTLEFLGNPVAQSYFYEIAAKSPQEIYRYVTKIIVQLSQDQQILDIDYWITAYALENPIIRDALCSELYSAYHESCRTLYQTIAYYWPLPALLLLALEADNAGDRFLASAYVAVASGFSTDSASNLHSILHDIFCAGISPENVRKYTQEGAKQAQDKLENQVVCRIKTAYFG